jgi:hypothetical protein
VSLIKRTHIRQGHVFFQPHNFTAHKFLSALRLPPHNETTTTQQRPATTLHVYLKFHFLMLGALRNFRTAGSYQNKRREKNTQTRNENEMKARDKVVREVTFLRAINCEKK